MIICQCRNISDKDVKAYLQRQNEKVHPREVKNACARQNCARECNNCACNFVKLAKDHNLRMTVRDIGKALNPSRSKEDIITT